ncbi:MAG TPA: hypothetical protein VKS98_05580, partial [Chthoniobacterales bacterium]|nr:hypothetical protein [Chthoniobacterales bacterium]
MSYRVAPIFLIRMAGVPFDTVEQLATPKTSAAAKNLLFRRQEFCKCAQAVNRFLQSRGRDLSKELYRAWKKTLHHGAPPPPEPALDVFERIRVSSREMGEAESCLNDCMQNELGKSRAALHEAAGKILPAYLVFTDAAMRDRLNKEFCSNLPPHRNKQARARERHVLLYLQRVCAKNDSLSAFGPEGWGNIQKAEPTIRLAPKPGITHRETFLERWTAHAAAVAINADAEVDSKINVRALEPHAFDVLCEDVAKWTLVPARDRWLSILRPIAELPKKFAVASSVSARIQTMDEANARLAELGAHRQSTRFLYA